MFAENYFKRNQISGKIVSLPHPDLGIVVVIPCFREPDILQTLQSVSRCALPDRHVEVIILINHSEVASDNVKAQNHQTRQEIDEWIKIHTAGKLKFFALGPVELMKKWAGAGLARKYGMDEAVSRFNLLSRPEGIIVSLDADTLVDENYLPEINNYFRKNPSHAGATIKFKHRTEGLEEKHLQGICLYEKYMDYYKQAMGYTGYPYPMFTIGSAFATTAGAYVKRGGMNRRQAGEDFYFLQNLVQIGTVGEITSTTVYPSARLSDRVPFGTGPVLQKWMRGEENLSKTYCYKAFVDLKQFFNKINLLFRISVQNYESLLSALPQPVEAFLREDGFWQELTDLNQNCATLTSFHLRFYHKFNAFKILKFLNFTHGKFYQKAGLEEQIKLLKSELKNS